MRSRRTPPVVWSARLLQLPPVSSSSCSSSRPRCQSSPRWRRRWGTIRQFHERWWRRPQFSELEEKKMTVEMAAVNLVIDLASLRVSFHFPAAFLTPPSVDDAAAAAAPGDVPPSCAATNRTPPVAAVIATSTGVDAGRCCAAPPGLRRRAEDSSASQHSRESDEDTRRWRGEN